jgi:membrane-associated protease RseP (regulator of RpoE activity)
MLTALATVLFAASAIAQVPAPVPDAPPKATPPAAPTPQTPDLPQTPGVQPPEGKAGAEADTRLDIERRGRRGRTRVGVDVDAQGRPRIDVDAGARGRVGVDAGTGGGRPLLGVQFSMRNGWLRIGRVLENSAALQAGLQINDEILAVDGARVSSFADLQARLRASAQAGQGTTIHFWRDGRLEQVQVTLDAAAAAETPTGERRQSYYRGPEGTLPTPPEGAQGAAQPATPEGAMREGGTYDGYYQDYGRRRYWRRGLFGRRR